MAYTPTSYTIPEITGSNITFLQGEGDYPGQNGQYGGLLISEDLAYKMGHLNDWFDEDYFLANYGYDFTKENPSLGDANRLVSYDQLIRLGFKVNLTEDEEKTLKYKGYSYIPADKVEAGESYIDDELDFFDVYPKYLYFNSTSETQTIYIHARRPETVGIAISSTNSAIIKTSFLRKKGIIFLFVTVPHYTGTSARNIGFSITAETLGNSTQTKSITCHQFASKFVDKITSAMTNTFVGVSRNFSEAQNNPNLEIGRVCSNEWISAEPDMDVYLSPQSYMQESDPQWISNERLTTLTLDYQNKEATYVLKTQIKPNTERDSVNRRAVIYVCSDYKVARFDIIQYGDDKPDADHNGYVRPEDDSHTHDYKYFVKLDDEAYASQIEETDYDYSKQDWTATWCVNGNAEYIMIPVKSWAVFGSTTIYNSIAPADVTLEGNITWATVHYVAEEGESGGDSEADVYLPWRGYVFDKPSNTERGYRYNNEYVDARYSYVEASYAHRGWSIARYCASGGGSSTVLDVRDFLIFRTTDQNTQNDTDKTNKKVKLQCGDRTLTITIKQKRIEPVSSFSTRDLGGNYCNLIEKYWHITEGWYYVQWLWDDDRDFAFFNDIQLYHDTADRGTSTEYEHTFEKENGNPKSWPSKVYGAAIIYSGGNENNPPPTIKFSLNGLIETRINRVFAESGDTQSNETCMVIDKLNDTPFDYNPDSSPQSFQNITINSGDKVMFERYGNTTEYEFWGKMLISPYQTISKKTPFDPCYIPNLLLRNGMVYITKK